MLNAIQSAGYSAPQSIIADGKFHRFATDSRKNYSKDGWYVCFGDVGSFGSWRDSNAITWSNGKSEITKEQREFVEREKKRAFEQAKAEAKATAERAKRVFENASFSGESAYLKRKGINTPFGCKFVKDMDSRAFGFEKSWVLNGLLVPVRDKVGELSTLQIITDEKKFFMPAGKTGGMFHVLGELDGATTIIIAEGIATAQSLREATGYPVVVSFSSGNLPLVATTIRSLCANAHIIVAGDNDDAGIKKANEAKSFSKAEVIIAEQGDFNDVHLAKGLSYVRDIFIKEEDDDLWRSELVMKHKSNGDSEVACRATNLILILNNAKEFKGRIALNTFSGQIAVDAKDVIESTAIKLKAEIERSYIQEKVSTNEVIEAMHVVAENNEFHPVRDYLNSLKWDGVKRICEEDGLLLALGCPNDDYFKQALRYFFISAVKRIFHPACKVDMMLILESAQGLRKSTFFKILFGEWYAEVTSSLNDKDFFMGLRGVWGADFGELDQFSKADSTRIKQILTMVDDHYRPAYARLAQKFPRQCVFIGGTNRDDWQKDETGGRRFLPIRITEVIETDWVEKNRDQLWAEAVHLMNTVDKWWDVSNATEHQAARYVGDSWDEIIANYLFAKSETSTNDILTNCLKIEIGKHSKADATRIGQIMAAQHKNWIKKQVMRNGVSTRIYVKT